MRPKAYVAGDMAVFWRETYGPKAILWVEGLCRPIHLPWAQSGLHPTPVVRSFEAKSPLWCGVDKLG